MAFFLGIGGPWIILMVLDLFWTKQGLEPSSPDRRGGLQERLEHLLQQRDKVPSRARDRHPRPPSPDHTGTSSGSNSYLNPGPTADAPQPAP